MKRKYGSVCGVIALSIFSFGASAQPAPAIHDLHISRSDRVDLADARADEILNEASLALQTDDDGTGSGLLDDVGCPVTLRRQGAITTFAAPRDLASRSDWNRLKGIPGSIKVVRNISWCAGSAPRAIGCGSTPGTSFVIERYTVERGVYEMKLWAHEFGHNTGLGHNTSNPRAIMGQGASKVRREVNARECSSFLRGPRRGGAAIMAESSGGVAGGESPEVSSINPLPSIAAFVQQAWVEGVPFNLASEYPSTTIPYLTTLLYGEDIERAATAVAVLGAIGASEATEQIISFLYRSELVLALSEGDASLWVDTLLSLGWLVNRSGDTQALRFLVQGIRPESWDQFIAFAQKGSGQAFAPKQEDWRQTLVYGAIRGLALTGHPEGTSVLERLQPSEFISPGMNLEDIAEFLKEARETSEIVSSLGLNSYYHMERAKFEGDMNQ